MTSAMGSYEQLVRQVEALKAENTHLRQELRDNSSHLSKLETETSGMKVRACMEGMGQKALMSWEGSSKHVDCQGDRCLCVQAACCSQAYYSLPCPQEVLKHLQGKLEQEARVLVSSGQTEVLEQLKGE